MAPLLIISLVISLLPGIKCFGIQSSRIESTLRVEDLWNQLEIKGRPFLTMPYRDFRVPIYEHKNNDPKADNLLFLNRFFYSPVPVLDESSISITKNEETNQAEVKFRIEMWNGRLEREVALYLKEVIGKEIKLHQLQIVPFDRLLVTGQSASMKSWKKYELEKSVWFSLPCQQCHKVNFKALAKELTVRFTLDSALSLRGQLAVNIDEVITSIQTYQSLREFAKEDTVYVSSEVVDQLISETVDYIEREMLNRQQVLLSHSLLRKQLHKMFVSSRKLSIDEIDQNLIYKPKKPTKKDKNEDYDYEEIDKMLMDAVEVTRNTSYYAIDLQKLENSEHAKQLSFVYSLAMMATSVKLNDSTLFRDGEVHSQKDAKVVDLSEIEKRFKDLEKQLLSQIEKAKDEAARSTKSEVIKLDQSLRRMKAHICPDSISPQSHCETVPFFGCYCFSIDKKRNHHEAASLCKDNGMRLVSLEGRMEKEQFLEIVEKEQRLKTLVFWTSGTRLNSKDYSSKNSSSSKGVTAGSSSAWGWTWTGIGKLMSNWNWMQYEPGKQEGQDYVTIHYPTRNFQTYPAGVSSYSACEYRFGWPVDP